jgi:phenylalanyl-tRNA synthetase beta chain
MNISLNWLSEFVDQLGSDAELDDLLTRAGMKVENFRKTRPEFPKIVIAQIIESLPHSNAERLSVCRVDDGSGQPRQIVCGAKNYKVGDKVPLALPGAVLPGGMEIRAGRLRGVDSEGMLCSANELELADDAQGLLILPDDAPVGRPLSELYPADTVFELEITPNRPDCLSHVGVAREVAAFSGTRFLCAAVEPEASRAALEHEVAIRAPDACPFYSLRRIRDVKVAPSPKWLSERLSAVGVRPINNVVDVTNYVMLEMGQPLHAFDAAKIRGGILVRSARAGEKFRALDGREYLLSGGDLAIADSDGPVALAGIMGGEESSVTDATAEIFLESALFEPGRVRRSARSHNLQSESSYRFERGVDPAAVLGASARAMRLIEELAGAHGDLELLTAGELPAAPAPITMRMSRCRSLIGTDLSPGEIRDSLSRLGLKAETADEEVMSWSIPSYRRDLGREVDLIEEVVRVLGIERIRGRATAAPAPPGKADEFYDLQTNVRQQICALGLSEARLSTLVSEKMAWFGEPALRLRNPLGEEQAFLRTSLLPGLIAALARNIRYGARSIRLFEIGRAFHAGNAENELLAFVLQGEVSSKSWRAGTAREFDWHDAKGLLEALAGTPVTCARIEAGSELALAVDVFALKKRIGFLGQLSLDLARTLDAAKPVLVAEISLQALQAARRLPVFRGIPKFPAVVRDLAIVCPAILPYGEIENELWSAGEELLEGIEPFDIYTDATGEKLPADRKSIAISLTFRSPQRTLNSEEVSAACERLKRRLKAKLAVDFRE